MIVEALGIGSNSPSTSWGVGLVTTDGSDDDGFGLGVVLTWIRPDFRAVRHPVHLSLIGQGEPILEMVGSRRNDGRSDSDCIKTQRSSDLFELNRPVHRSGGGEGGENSVANLFRRLRSNGDLNLAFLIPLFPCRQLLD